MPTSQSGVSEAQCLSHPEWQSTLFPFFPQSALPGSLSVLGQPLPLVKGVPTCGQVCVGDELITRRRPRLGVWAQQQGGAPICGVGERSSGSRMLWG